MAETLKTIWVVERRTDVSDWHAYDVFRSRADARYWASLFNIDDKKAGLPYIYRVAKYVRA